MEIFLQYKNWVTTGERKKKGTLKVRKVFLNDEGGKNRNNKLRFLRGRVSHSDMQNRNNRVRGKVGVQKNAKGVIQRACVILLGSQCVSLSRIHLAFLNSDTQIYKLR